MVEGDAIDDVFHGGVDPFYKAVTIRLDDEAPPSDSRMEGPGCVYAFGFADFTFDQAEKYFLPFTVL